ncbi:hypothetical protein [Paramagnetospirillum marisnigri]|uniref:hypothetical protein n=1 Tax=Paramagnetospirillum marisnigri TaxID=1285242 RepID=UPI000AACFF49|nr:hypothetical protein [Paramagnetospirillum marisnigri]
MKDDATLRQTTAFVLEEIGHQVVAAPSAQVILTGETGNADCLHSQTTTAASG